MKYYSKHKIILYYKKLELIPSGTNSSIIYILNLFDLLFDLIGIKHRRFLVSS